jgi:short-chain Z-isoprenyl diphosphate synthase
MGRIRTLVGDVAYDLYGHRLTSSLPHDQLPAHVGVILDGNRRWAAEMGSPSAHGHRAGGEKITEFLELLPKRTTDLLNRTKLATENVPGLLVNVAIGYGGRQEVVDAVRSLLLEESKAGQSLDEVASKIDIEHIAAHLYTKGQPDPDLVIRTSGEQRLSGFLLWQSAHSEFYFCEAYWPNFRKIDFLRAVRSYAARNRRFGI